MFIPYKQADGTTILVEVTDEVGAFILENDREIANADRRERYHAPYHIEAMKYEGAWLSTDNDPLDAVIRQEEKERVDYAMSKLTDTQFRRLTMKADGMNLREIAEAEGTSIAAVKESLDLAIKKIKMFYKDT